MGVSVITFAKSNDRELLRSLDLQLIEIAIMFAHQILQIVFFFHIL